MGDLYVRLKNVQSITEAEYVFGEKGITQIIGENSNGKSIVVKALSFVANSKLEDIDERKDIINDDSIYAEITQARNGAVLVTHIEEEAVNCYMSLTRADGTCIKRTLRESGHTELIDEFGWMVFDNGNICLQIFETFGIMPFVNNKKGCDYEIVDYAITDKVSNDFVTTFEKVTYPEFKKIVNGIKAKKEGIENQIGLLTIYDVDIYQKYLNKLKEYDRVISVLSPIKINKLPMIKGLQAVNIEPIKVKKLPMVRMINSAEKVVNLSELLDNLHTALNGFCPLCKTKLKDMVVEDNEA